MMLTRSWYKWGVAAFAIIVLLMIGILVATPYLAQEWGDALYGGAQRIEELRLVREDAPEESKVVLGEEVVANLVSVTWFRDGRGVVSQRVFLAVYENQEVAKNMHETPDLIGVLDRQLHDGRLIIRLFRRESMLPTDRVAGRLWLVYPSSFVAVYERP